MGVTSYAFVFAFLPIVLLGWMTLNKINKYKEANLFLIIASLVFIGSYDIRFIAILVITVLFNYRLTKYMNSMDNRNCRKALMIILLIANVGLLLFLKYGNWIRTLFDASTIMWKMIIPIGISFYTLEQICFVVDCYKREEMKYTFGEYLLFSTYFPVIISGPILRHDDFISQLREENCRKISERNISEGLISFCIGMGKKVVIASWLGIVAAEGFDDVVAANGFIMILSVIAYTLQLYFDFSGYCDIVEGVSMMLGFNLPMNFNSPYKAVSIGDFWKRWHMTLTAFLTKYIYIPIGGNKKGKIKQFINILIVFLVSGLWHGASVTYILWGLMHGICLIFDKIIGKTWAVLPKIIGRIVTFAAVAIMWVPFRASSVHDTYVIYWTLLFGDKTIVHQFGHTPFPIITYIWELYTNINSDMLMIAQDFITVFILLILIVIVFYGKNTREIRVKGNKKISMAILCGAVLFLSVIQFEGVGTFIYEGF